MEEEALEQGEEVGQQFLPEDIGQDVQRSCRALPWDRRGNVGAGSGTPFGQAASLLDCTPPASEIRIRISTICSE